MPVGEYANCARRLTIEAKAKTVLPRSVRDNLSELTVVHVTRQHSGGSGMTLRFPARA